MRDGSVSFFLTRRFRFYFLLLGSCKDELSLCLARNHRHRHRHRHSHRVISISKISINMIEERIHT